MVAELSDIFTATVDDKASPGDTSGRRKRAKWIRTATREPIYSVLDSDESLPPNIHGKIVVISAVKNNESSRKSPPESRASPTLEVEDTLYSVVRKPKKVRLPETSFSEEAVRQPVDRTRIGNTAEKTQQLDNPEDASGRVEVRKWLSDKPRRALPELPGMYTDRGEYENPWHDHRESSVAMPRGVVGLVGPYRVYGNPNERREYMLQEEELVEEIVDSASERVQEEGSKEEHRQRAKWKIREDDEETLVPDIRDLPSLEMKSVMGDGKENDEWKEERRSPTEKSGCVERIMSGKEERAVDVPDTVSAISTKDKWGETVS